MSKPTSFLVPLAAAILGIAGSATSVDAAVAYWSFQTAAGAASPDLTLNNGFQGTPTLTWVVGTGQNSTVSVGQGGVKFTPPGSSTEYSGANIGENITNTGMGLNWSTPQAVGNRIVGASFTFALNTTTLYDLGVQFDVRAAVSATGNTAPGKFSAMEYSYDNTNWSTISLTSPTWANATGSNWERKTLDLSSVDAIENQGIVYLRFTLENSSNPAAAVNMNIRIDNLLVTAVPEPSAVMLLGGAAVAAVLRRRK